MDGKEASRRASQDPRCHKAYDTAECVQALREADVTPHVAQNDTNRQRAIDQRTTRHAGYGVSLKVRKLIETRIGWIKDIGTPRIDAQLRLNAVGFNLLHLANLMRAAPA